MQTTKASLVSLFASGVCFVQMFIVAADCSSVKKEEFVISEAEFCNGDYRLFLVQVYFLLSVALIFTAVLLIWRTRKPREFSLLNDKE